MKAILLSIRPEHAYNILNGNKTLELRKSVPKGFVGWVYVYVTKAKPAIVWHPTDCVWSNWEEISHDDDIYGLWDWKELAQLNGTIPFRFWFDEYETYTYKKHGLERYTDVAEYDIKYDELEKLQLDYREVEKYGQGKTLYAWHIKNLQIFDEPIALSEFGLKRAPQSWYYIYINKKSVLMQKA